MLNLGPEVSVPEILVCAVETSLSSENGSSTALDGFSDSSDTTLVATNDEELENGLSEHSAQISEKLDGFRAQFGEDADPVAVLKILSRSRTWVNNDEIFSVICLSYPLVLNPVLGLLNSLHQLQDLVGIKYGSLPVNFNTLQRFPTYWWRGHFRRYRGGLRDVSTLADLDKIQYEFLSLIARVEKHWAALVVPLREVQELPSLVHDVQNGMEDTIKFFLQEKSQFQVEAAAAQSRSKLPF